MELAWKRSAKVSLGWIALLLLVAGTFALTRKIDEDGNLAATLFSRGQDTHNVYLYEDRIEPREITARPKDEIIFIVMDESRHNLAEERSSQKDARLVSGEFQAGESYSLIFGRPGMYSFYDRMNLDLQVTIVVK